MRYIVGFIRFFVSLFLLILGGLLVMYEKKIIYREFDNFYQRFLEQAPPFDYYREAAGGVLVALGLLFVLFQWLAWIRRKKERSISFMGTQGEVTIDLEPVESTLEKVALRLPEVQHIRITMKPIKGSDKVHVDAVAILKKDPDDDARMVTARVQNFLKIHATKITGLQEVEAKLRVKRWRMSVKSLKPEPLLLQAPDGQPETGVTQVDEIPDAHMSPVSMEDEKILMDTELEDPLKQ
jgi:hypothetical protein